MTTHSKVTGVATGPASAQQKGRCPLKPLKRRKLIKLRVTEEEHARARAIAAGNLSKVIRALLRSEPLPRARRPACQCGRLLQIVSTRMHLVARRAQDIPNPHTVVEILAHLVCLERLVQAAVEKSKP